MRALLAISARELRERWTLPLASFFFGFVPVVLALRAGERPLPMVAVLAAPTAWTVALMMGGSVIARDLGEGRLGFYFSRPVAWWAIAAGKLLAALLLTMATALAAALPSMLAEPRLATHLESFGRAAASGTLGLFLALLLGLVGLGHAAGVVYRSRSAWAALDFLLFAATVVGAVAAVRAFVRLGAVSSPHLPSPWILALVLLLIAMVPLSAAVAQVAGGRSDLRRGHRLLSATFWGGVLACFTVVGVLLARERAATPIGFPERQVAGAGGDGRFVALLATDGEARGRTASFLLDTNTGRFLRIPVQHVAAIAPEGGHAVWVEEAPFWRQHDLDLRLARLGGPAPVVETIELDPPIPGPSVRHLALAGVAERLAIVQDSTLSVHELPSGRALSRTAAADGDWVTAAFLSDGRLRALRRVRPVVGGPGRGVLPGFLEIVELAGGVPSSRVPLDAVGHAVPASGLSGERILLHEPGAPRIVSLHEATSGRRLRVFAGEPGWPVNDAALLGDGRVAVVEGSGAVNRLRLAADGEADRLIELPAGFATLGGELPGGRIVIGLRSTPRVGSAGETVTLACATGEIVRREAGLVPVVHQGIYGGARDLSGAATLFQSQSGELVRLDPGTGARRVVLAAKAAR